MKRATFDLDCPKAEIELTVVGHHQFGARGCGQRASYTVEGECTIPGSCKAVLDSGVEGAKPKQDAPSNDD